MTTDDQYATLIRACLSGSPVITRNSLCYRTIAHQIHFASTPLVCARRTSWRNALREWEWFMSGSNRLEDLHPSVHSWWKPFCKVDDKTLCYNYSKSFRRIYSPETGPIIDVKPKSMPNDMPLEVPRFPVRDVVVGSAKHLGYKGANCHGDTFRVVDYVGDSKYVVQFDSNGYCVESRPVNFLKGTVKNPYFPTVNDVGCYGVVDKSSYSYHDRAYDTWCGMMGRCYNSARRSYRWYGAKGVKVAARWKCFECFINDLSSVPGFEEWLLNPGDYALDKDYLKANYYGPDSCIFFRCDRNTALASAERFYSVPRRVVEVDQVAMLIDGIKNHPHSRRNVITTWVPSHVESGLMEPTNCHNTVTQAFVEPADNSLHLVTYQRSVDVICGVPHNWIQMWAFGLWLAHRSGRTFSSLTWIGGDCHVYDAHRDLANRILLCNRPVGTPNLTYTPTSDEFRADDFALDAEYVPVLTDRAEMIV